MEIGNGSTNAGERLTEFSGNSQEKRKYQNNSYGLDKKSTVWSKVACLKQQICRKQSSSRSLLLFNSECLNVPARFLGVLDYLTMCCRNSYCLIHAPILDNLKTLISNHRSVLHSPLSQARRINQSFIFFFVIFSISQVFNSE